MQDRRVIAAVAAAVVLALAVMAFIALAPGGMVAALDAAARQQLGRQFSAKGVHLSLSPLALRIDGATLSGLTETGDRLLEAKSMIVPVSFGQLLSHRASLGAVTLHEAEVALLINERGEASWDLPAALPPDGVSVTLEQASFRYFDARNDHALSIANVNGLLRLEAGGGVSFTGSAIVKGRLVRIDASLKSLARVNEDGSPLEIAISSDAAAASFSGRLSTARVMSLAGPLSISSGSPSEALRWAGLPVPPDLVIPGPLEAEGALDSAGRAYGLRNATLALGTFRAAGDLTVDLRGVRPKLEANLTGITVWLDALLPSSGARPGEWGRAPLPFAILKSFDAEVSLVSRTISYYGLAAGATRLAATLKDGTLEASGATRLAEGGGATFTAKADANALPPSLSLSLKAENAEAAPLLTALLGISNLTGRGGFAADLSALGQTQEELVGTLKGSASLSLAEGRIAGSDLAGLAGAVRERILPGWQAAPGGTPFTRLEAAASLTDGIAALGPAEITTPALTFSITGGADLLRRALDVSATATAGGTPVLPVPVIVRGPWEAPKIYPDIPGILDNPEGGFARLKDASPIGDN